MARKITATRSSTDQTLIEFCKKETGYSECNIGDLINPTTEPPTNIFPPEDTVAVVVDISEAGGRMKIYDKSSGKYCGGVGVEEREDLVIVLWNKNWEYYTIGSLNVRYVIGR